MTLPVGAYLAVSQCCPAAFTVLPVVTNSSGEDDESPATTTLMAANDLPLERCAVVVDVMQFLEPSMQMLGMRSKKQIAELAKQLDRPLTEEDHHCGEPATFQEWGVQKLRFIADYLQQQGVVGVVAVFDLGSPTAKLPEHQRRYGKQKEDVASDQEVTALLEHDRLPRKWKRFRGNRTFSGALKRMLATLLERLPLPAGKWLLVCGDPRQPHPHIAVEHRMLTACESALAAADALVAAAAAADSGTSEVSRAKRRRVVRFLDDANMHFSGLEADFEVIAKALWVARPRSEGGLCEHVVIDAIDGDTWLAGLLAMPRYADARTLLAVEMQRPLLQKDPLLWERRILVLRRCGQQRTLIDLNVLYASIMEGEFKSLIGPKPKHPIELLVAMMMLFGNDYVWTMPQIGAKTLIATLRAHASEFSHLVEASAPSALAARPWEPHQMRIQRSLLHQLVERIYEKRGAKIKAVHMPSSERRESLAACLEWTLYYFANASNPRVPIPDAYARSATGLSLHGFETHDGLAPTRLNARYAECVEPRL